MDRLENIPPAHLPVVFAGLIHHQQIVDKKLRNKLALLRTDASDHGDTLFWKEKVRVAFTLAKAKGLEDRPSQASACVQNPWEKEEYVRLFQATRAHLDYLERHQAVAALRERLQS